MISFTIVSIKLKPSTSCRESIIFTYHTILIMNGIFYDSLNSNPNKPDPKKFIYLFS